MPAHSNSNPAAPQPKPLSELDLLYHIARTGAAPFCNEFGLPCLGFPSEHHGVTVLTLRSPDVRDWLTAAALHQLGTPPREYNFRAALLGLRATATYSGEPRRFVGRRLLGLGRNPYLPERIILDLAGPSGRVVEITPQGWNIVSGRDYFFYRDDAVEELPEPETPADPDRLLACFRDLLRIPDDRAWRRVLGWLAAALRPVGACPILVLHGPPGAGKSAAARILKDLIDPSPFTLLSPDLPEDRLFYAAWRSRVLTIDHAGRISERLAGCLCRLSTGAGYLLREARFDEPTPVTLQRPIILTLNRDETARAPWLRRPILRNPSLAARSLLVAVGQASACHPTESSLQPRFEPLRAPLLGLLCTAAATAMRRFRDIRFEESPSCVNAAHWAVAAAPAFNIADPEMLDAFLPERPQEPVIVALAHFMRHRDSWTGTVTELQDTLQLPMSLKAVSCTLRDSSAELAAVGLDVDFSRSNGRRRLRIRKRTDSAGSASQTRHSDPQPAQADHATAQNSMG